MAGRVEVAVSHPRTRPPCAPTVLFPIASFEAGSASPKRPKSYGRCSGAIPATFGTSRGTLPRAYSSIQGIFTYLTLRCIMVQGMLG